MQSNDDTLLWKRPCLTTANKGHIQEKKKLIDRHINSAQNILKEQFWTLGGLQPNSIAGKASRAAYRKLQKGDPIPGRSLDCSSTDSPYWQCCTCLRYHVQYHWSDHQEDHFLTYFPPQNLWNWFQSVDKKEESIVGSLLLRLQRPWHTSKIQLRSNLICGLIWWLVLGAENFQLFSYLILYTFYSISPHSLSNCLHNPNNHCNHRMVIDKSSTCTWLQ